MNDLNKTLISLQRKLDRMALDQLREHVIELRAQLDRAEALLSRSDEEAEHWRENFMQLQLASCDDDFASHRCIGLNKAGEMMVVKMDTAHD